MHRQVNENHQSILRREVWTGRRPSQKVAVDPPAQSPLRCSLPHPPLRLIPPLQAPLLLLPQDRLKAKLSPIQAQENCPRESASFCSKRCQERTPMPLLLVLLKPMDLHLRFIPVATPPQIITTAWTLKARGSSEARFVVRRPRPPSNLMPLLLAVTSRPRLPRLYLLHMLPSPPSSASPP